MQIEIDEHLRMTLEFMQANIPEAKLLGVANAVPQAARLLWDHVPKEPVLVAALTKKKECSPLLQHATVLIPVDNCVGGDSAVAEDAL